MLMLEDLENALEREIEHRKRSGESFGNEDEDNIVEQFQKAARLLIERQVVHADDRTKSAYRMICRHEPYFALRCP